MKTKELTAAQAQADLVADDDEEPTYAEVRAALSEMYADAQHIYDYGEEMFNCVCIARLHEAVAVEEFLEYVIEQRDLYPDHVFATEDGESVVRVWCVPRGTYLTVLD